MNVKLSKWGNSAAVRLPKPVLEQAKLKPGDDLEISVEGTGRIVLQARTRKYTLDELLAGLTGKNRHGESDWGAPAGKEAW